MNLVNDIWIPVRRKSGKVEYIAPWQITEVTDDGEIIGLAAPRADFNGALIQFLIGLLQTNCAPRTPPQWREWLQQPPDSQRLRDVFQRVAFAFELDGDGPRFMQDLTLEEEVQKLPFKKQQEMKKSVCKLLIDSPGDKTLEDNTDHFIKRGRVEQMCPACSAMALFTLQINAPSGGQGQRTGLRGGGPMTTLVLADTLWKTCWLNTLEGKTFLSPGNPNRNNDSDHFPWLAHTRTSEGGEGTTPNDTHPDQIFWSMPRRIRLIESVGLEDATCDLCGRRSDCMVRHFITKNLGVNYAGPWVHPLSPYFIGNDGTPSVIHPQPGGIVYRHWLGLVQFSEKRQPARVVEHFIIREKQKDKQLWAFGYDMDNMKARCWYDSTMPLILADDSIRECYNHHTATLVNSAQDVCRETQKQIRNALFKRPNDVKGDFSFVGVRFWQETEADFFTYLYNLREALSENHDVTLILEDWHKCLARKAETIFNDISQSGAFDAADPKRIALAWRDLQKSIHSKRLYQ